LVYVMRKRHSFIIGNPLYVIVHSFCLALYEGSVEKWLGIDKGVNKSKPFAHEKYIGIETNFS